MRVIKKYCKEYPELKILMPATSKMFTAIIAFSV
jgi:hypothetical protein